MTPEVRDWDADAYHRVSGPQETWSDAVIDRLDLRGDETVLDAGCGSGRVTRRLLSHLPRGRVIGVDSSADMVARARAELGPEVRVFRADLAELRLDEQVDAVFSNAVFHWVPDHEALFAALAAALRPGGRLSAQCGGEGNIANVHEAALDGLAELGLAHRFTAADAPWNFAPAGRSEDRLHAAGFSVARAWVQDWPVTPDDPRAFLQTVCLGPYIERLEAVEVEPFVDAVTRRLDGPDGVVLEYVRLNLTGIRAGG